MQANQESRKTTDKLTLELYEWLQIGTRWSRYLPTETNSTCSKSGLLLCCGQRKHPMCGGRRIYGLGTQSRGNGSLNAWFVFKIIEAAIQYSGKTDFTVGNWTTCKKKEIENPRLPSFISPQSLSISYFLLPNGLVEPSRWKIFYFTSRPQR